MKPIANSLPPLSPFKQSLDAQLQRCINQPYSLPAECYTSEEVLAYEQQHLFVNQWIGIGRADRLANAGNYDTQRIGDVNLLLVRDKQGQLRAFNNACRHRGAKLMTGSGTCTIIKCPFHCWCYNLDGTLAAASHMEQNPEFLLEDHGLHEFALREHAGFIFLCCADNPPDFEAFIGDFDLFHQAWPLAELRSVRRASIQNDCNWKLFLEVFNEYYHLPFVHPNSINSTYLLPEPGDHTQGSYATQFGKTEGTGGVLTGQQEFALPDIPGLKEPANQGTRYTWLYPNMAFAASREGLWLYEAYPEGIGRCQVYQTLCFPAESINLCDFEQRVQHYYERMDAAVEEDKIALENQQLGMASAFTSNGPCSVKMEPNIANFANWYAKQLLQEV